jgi:hypothetical protein
VESTLAEVLILNELRGCDVYEVVTLAGLKIGAKHKHPAAIVIARAKFKSRREELSVFIIRPPSRP